MSRKLASLLVGLTAVLSACTMPDDQYDYIVSDGVTVTVSSLDAKVGEAVTLTFTGSLELDEKSRVPERAVSDISVGMCFTHGLTANGEVFADPHGLCEGEVESLPPSYKLLNGTDYHKKFDNVVIPRGEKREFAHSFTFTLDEADELVLVPFLVYTDEPFPGPTHSSIIGGDWPTLTFK